MSLGTSRFEVLMLNSSSLVIVPMNSIVSPSVGRRRTRERLALVQILWFVALGLEVTEVDLLGQLALDHRLPALRCAPATGDERRRR